MRLLKAAVVFFSILLTACESSSKGSEAQFTQEEAVRAYSNALVGAMRRLDTKGELKAYALAHAGGTASKPSDSTPQVMTQLATRAPAYMPDQSLKERFAAFVTMLTSSDESTCARISRHQATGTEYGALVGRLDPGTLKRWSEATVLATIAASRVEQPPFRTMSDAEYANALNTVADALPPEEAEKFRISMTGVAPLRDSDLCKLQIALYSRAASLGSEGATLRHVLARLESEPTRALKTPREAAVFSERWLVTTRNDIHSVAIDTTRIQRLSESVYRIWLKTTSDIMTQNDYDCAGRRVKTLSYEQRGIPRDLPSNAREWYEMPPESDGEKGLIDVCTYLGKRFGTR